jgi:nucleoside-diphosphate-sugar epimerase
VRHGKVLINGAGGFLGSHTVEAFLEAGYDCRLTDLPGMPLDWAKPLGGERVEVVHADLRDPDAARAVTQGVAGVVNVAGLFDFGQPWDRLYDSNVRVTENMCRAALQAGVDKFVHIASVAVYGTPATLPIAEDGPRRPDNDYEKTKALGEDVVFRYQRQSGLPATSLRPAPIYGPRSRYIHSLFFATAALMAARSGGRSVAFADGVLSHHVHVRDVARATVLLMALPRTIGNAYNCADLTPLRWHRLFAAIAELVGLVPARTLPWPRGLMSAALPVLSRLWPDAALRAANERLARAWSELVAERGLEPALRPRLERDMFRYMAADHAYQTHALRELGFRWEYPHVLDGLAATHAWLVEHRWIPG